MNLYLDWYFKIPNVNNVIYRKDVTDGYAIYHYKKNDSTCVQFRSDINKYEIGDSVKIN